MEPRKQDVDVKEPRTSKMIDIDVTDFDVFSKNLDFIDFFPKKKIMLL